MNRKIFLIPFFFLVMWGGLNFYQIKVSHNRCYDMGYIRGLPESIPCFDKERRIEQEKLRKEIDWLTENYRAVLSYIWHLGV